MHDAPGPTTRCATALIDIDHPAVIAFAHEHGAGAGDARERAVALYVAVRDGFRYDPYRVDLSIEGMRASSVLASGRGWCVTKAALLVAAARTLQIPARLAFADVRNHLSTERMRRTMGTDLFLWHGCAELWIDGAWRKATPAFNIELCEKFGLLPLAWDGRSDSLYHPFDRSGAKHMEYVNLRGSFDDVPLEAIRADFAATYPRWGDAPMAAADFDRDVQREVSR
jgi:transglutaminase-like putative cysteine protease